MRCVQDPVLALAVSDVSQYKRLAHTREMVQFSRRPAGRPHKRSISISTGPYPTSDSNSLSLLPFLRLWLTLAQNKGNSFRAVSAKLKNPLHLVAFKWPCVFSSKRIDPKFPPSTPCCALLPLRHAKWTSSYWSLVLISIFSYTDSHSGCVSSRGQDQAARTTSSLI